MINGNNSKHMFLISYILGEHEHRFFIEIIIIIIIPIVCHDFKEANTKAKIQNSFA